MNNDLILQSKRDIPFKECLVNIHQPTIDEISIIGEESFRTGLQFLNFTKDQLSEEDKLSLTELSDFNIFMSIMCSKEQAKYKIDTLLVLTLLFPQYQIHMKEEGIELQDGDFITLIDEQKYEIFKDIINSMFDIVADGPGSKYNPADARAAKIAEKFKKRQQKKIESSKQVEKVSIYSRYVSILSVGLQKDKNDLMQYTVAQLMDEFERFQLKQSFDIYIQAKMAGAKDLEDVENWMGDLHSTTK